MPTRLGNEYPDTFSLVKWILVCDATPSEEIPDDPPPIDGPDTGDSIFPAMMALLIAAASAVIMVFFFLLLVKSRKEKEKETAEVTNRVIR